MDIEKNIGEREENPVLPAEDVLNALIAKFKFEAPYLFSNPIQYYIDLIDGFLPENIDIFPVKSWKRRLDGIDKYLGEIDKQIISLDTAAAKKDIVDITKILGKINCNFLLYDDLEHVLRGVLLPLLSSKNRIENSEEVLDFLDAILNLLYIKAENIDTKEINLFLERIIMTFSYHERKIKQEKLVGICDKIIDICNQKDDCKVLCLTVLGIKSDFVDKKKSTILRNSIIQQGRHQLDNEEIARLILISIFRQINEQKMVSDDYRNIMSDIREKYKNNKKLLEDYYSTILNLIDEKIEIDISITDVFAQINMNELSSDLLLKAYKVYCDTEEDANNKIKMAMDAIEQFDIDKINNCKTCVDYAFLLREIVVGKINLKETVEQKYIEYGIDLCHKEESCFFISQIIINMLINYINTVENLYERKELCKKSIEICKNSKLYENWIVFNDIYFECIEKKERDIYLKNNKQYKDFRESRIKMATAIGAYIEHDSDLCKNILLEVSENFDEIFDEKYNPALINICFMMRRGEIPEIEIPVLDMLNKIIWMDNEAFFNINKALALIMQDEWEKAREEIRKIEYHLEEAVQWWNQEDVVGKEEKVLVLGLLILENKVEIDIEILEFIELNINNVFMPDAIKQEINQIKVE